ncbi:Outer membrane protein 40 [termite gut metagenome]|uniref:Outer membrane protein 40 n=1 Tax=termite gut metagenome TaxID=433724 RepID=A0A5J4QQ01_9ZZZZ
MKRKKSILVLLLSLFFVITGMEAKAVGTFVPGQKDALVREETLRSYHVFDNLFAGINLGATYSAFDANNLNFKKVGDYLSPDISIYLGKWISPTTGIRLSYEWGKNKTLNRPSRDLIEYSRYGGFGDVLFNLNNVFGTYKENQRWSVVPFAGIGFIRGVGNGSVHSTNNLAARFGLQLNYRITDALTLNLEGSGNLVDDNFNAHVTGVQYDGYVNTTIGISYRFKNSDNNRYFKKLSVADAVRSGSLADAPDNQGKVIQELEKLIGEQKNTISTQAQKINELEQQLLSVADKDSRFNLNNAHILSPVLTFKINEFQILEHHEPNIFLVAQTLKDNPNMNLTITGYADKATGTPEVNKNIANLRATSVKRKLVNEYGINSDRLEVISVGSEAQIFEKNNWNRAIIFILSNK